jgi:L-arabinose isomerase
VLSSAIGSEELVDLAEMARVELAVIEHSTTRRGFANELRWNQAFHRLAQGL